ncbi:aldo/keto reductase [Variovorax paradoxus]|uniref:aldo/keto reductase n=1 Tax=Variovorax paradoxus TaxID=34073 RepID=UPI003ECE1A29
MQYAQLGQTGIFVSRICLGAMTFGGADTPAGNVIGRLDQPEVNAIVSEALDAGINFIDTADVYSGGASEELLGVALDGRRREVVLATKVGARLGPGPNQTAQSRLHIMEALEGSLRRLRTDHIDLYQLHNFDPLTPLEEVLRVLDDAVRQGKVRSIGCSNFAAWQLMKALGISKHDGLTRFASIQSFYSLVGRDIEHELVPALLDSSTGLLCWSPLAGGLLSGNFDRNGVGDRSARRANIQFPPVDMPRAFDVIDVMKTIAQRHAASVAQVALAWLLAQPVVTSVISGVKRPAQLQDNLRALELKFSEAELAQLQDVSKLPVAYPGWIQTYNANGRFPSGHEFIGKSWRLGNDPV